MILKHIGLLAFLVSPIANATLISIDFGDPAGGSLQGSGDSTSYAAAFGAGILSVAGYKGVTLTEVGDNVTSTFTDREAVTVDLTGGGRGLAVDSDGSDDADLLDGVGPDEALLFSLPGGGSITQLVFNRFGSNDDFNLIVDGIVMLVDAKLPTSDIWNGALTFTQSFAIGADSSDDEFLVRGLTVRVAEPSAAALMVPSLALLGLLMLRRRTVRAPRRLTTTRSCRNRSKPTC